MSDGQRSIITLNLFCHLSYFLLYGASASRKLIIMGITTRCSPGAGARASGLQMWPLYALFFFRPFLPDDEGEIQVFLVPLVIRVRVSSAICDTEHQHASTVA